MSRKVFTVVVVVVCGEAFYFYSDLICETLEITHSRMMCRHTRKGAQRVNHFRLVLQL